MGFYLRKSFRAGPLRFNLSKSGIGVSAGVTGARLGMSSTGRAYVHGGRGGLYYRKSVGSGSKDGRAMAERYTHVLEAGVRARGPAIELTEETGVTYGTPEKPEETERTGTSARLVVAPGGLLAVGVVGVLLVAAILGAVPWWVVPAASVLWALGLIALGRLLRRAGRAYGRLLDERLGGSDPLTDESRAELDAARANRWLLPARARYAEQTAYLELLGAGMAAGWEEPADLERLAQAERILSLDPAFVQRAKLNAYLRLHVEATADHDLTEAEETALERARTAFGLSDDDLAEEMSLLERLRQLREIREGTLPEVEAGTGLRSGEVCHLKSEGRLLKKRVLRSFTRDRQKYTVRGFVIDKAGTLLVTSKRILLIHEGMTSIPLDKVVDLEIDEDRQLLTLTRDGLVTPAYLTTPAALRTGAIIAALANC